MKRLIQSSYGKFFVYDEDTDTAQGIEPGYFVRSEPDTNFVRFSCKVKNKGFFARKDISEAENVNDFINAEIFEELKQ